MIDIYGRFILKSQPILLKCERFRIFCIRDKPAGLKLKTINISSPGQIGQNKVDLKSRESPLSLNPGYLPKN